MLTVIVENKIYIFDHEFIYVKTLTFEDDVKSISFNSRDGISLILFTNGKFILYDITIDQIIYKFRYQKVIFTFFSLDGSKILFADTYGILGNISIIYYIGKNRIFKILGHRSLETISLNYDGTVLLILNLRKIITKLDVKKCENIGNIYLDEEIKSLSFIPNGTKILVSFRSKTVMYDISTYQTTDIYEHSLDGLFCFNPMNQKLFISRNQHGFTLFNIELNHKYSDLFYDHPNKIFSSDGTKIISFYDKTVTIYDIETCCKIKIIKFNGYIEDIASKVNSYI